MKRIFYVFVLLLACVLSNTVFSQEPAVELDGPIPVDPKLITGKLDNGLTYYIMENENPRNRAELQLVVNAGSVLEDEDQRGLAHFCEHMAFNGTKNFPKHDLINYLESIGMKFGPEVNAYTSFDETVYMIKVPLDSAVYLDKGLQVLYDWAHNVLYEPEEIDKERGVIHEEWRIGQGAQDRMLRKTLPVIFHDSKYGERLPIGKTEIFDNCPPEALTRFYKDWYRPDLMAVVVVGDFDGKAMEEKVSKLFSGIPKPENPRKREIFEIPDHDETLVAIATDKEAQQTVVQVFYLHDVWEQEKVSDYKKHIAHNLFNSMINNRLGELMQQEDPPYAYAYSMYGGFLGPRDIYVSIAMTPGDKLERGLRTVLEENERLKKHGFTATELEREKKAAMRNIEKAYKEKDKMKSDMIARELHSNFSLRHEPVPGIEFEYEMHKKFLPEITLDEVNKLANEWIIDKNVVIVVNAPEKEDVKVPTEDDLIKIFDAVKLADLDPYVDKVADKPLMSEKPAPGKIAKEEDNKDLDFTEWTLDNGAKVVIKTTDFKEDEILFSAFSLGGYSLYSAGDNVSVSIASDVMMESGISGFDKIQLDKLLADKMVSIRPWISELREGFNGNSSPQDLETLLQMVNLYFTKARKDKTAFISYITRMKSFYENRSTSPEAAFRDTIQVTMAQHSPYERPMTDKLLDEANINKLHYYFTERFGDPGNFTFFFVGNIEPETAKPLIETYLGGLPKVTRNETWKDLNIRYPEGKIEKTVYKGTEPKSMVYMSINGSFDYTWENCIDLDAICTVLSTKLLESIREDSSGVYSIGAYPRIDHFPSSQYNIMIYFGCSPDNVENLTKGVFEQIEKLKKDGPEEKDIVKVKEKKLRTRETDLRENRFWLRKLQDLYYHKGDPGNLSKYEDYVKAFDNESLKKAANKYFNDSNCVRVVLRPEE